jgi:hypothetical protein
MLTVDEVACHRRRGGLDDARWLHALRGIELVAPSLLWIALLISSAAASSRLTRLRRGSARFGFVIGSTEL